MARGLRRSPNLYARPSGLNLSSRATRTTSTASCRGSSVFVLYRPSTRKVPRSAGSPSTRRRVLNLVKAHGERVLIFDVRGPGALTRVSGRRSQTSRRRFPARQRRPVPQDRAQGHGFHSAPPPALAHATDLRDLMARRSRPPNARVTHIDLLRLLLRHGPARVRVDAHRRRARRTFQCAHDGILG